MPRNRRDERGTPGGPRPDATTTEPVAVPEPDQQNPLSGPPVVPTEKATVVAQIEQLTTDESGLLIVTKGIDLAGIPSYTFRVPLTHPNYNAHFSLLLTASFNGYYVDFTLERPPTHGAPVGAPYTLASAAVRWTVFGNAPNNG